MPSDKMFTEAFQNELNAESRICVKADKIQAYILKIFEIQESLQEEAPEFNWKGLGNLMGDYGEYLAIKHFELTPTNRGTANADATMPDGTTVQIKTCLHSERIGFRERADKLLVLQIDREGGFRAIYNGNFPEGYTSHSARDSKLTIPLSQLIRLNEHALEPIPARNVADYPRRVSD